MKNTRRNTSDFGVKGRLSWQGTGKKIEDGELGRRGIESDMLEKVNTFAKEFREALFKPKLVTILPEEVRWYGSGNFYPRGVIPSDDLLELVMVR